MKKLTDQQIDEILVASNLVRIKSYTLESKSILVGCKICGHERTTNLGRLLYSVRAGHSPCPKCSRRIRYADDTIDNKIKQLPIMRKTNWVNDLTPLWWECKICKHTWETRLTKILNENTGCPKCSYIHRHDTLRLTSEIIDARLEGRSIKRDAPYPGNMKAKAPWVCLDCGYRWIASTQKIVNEYTGCPSCADVGGGRFGKRILKDGELFDSQLEYDCYRVLLGNIREETIIIRQHPYPHNKRMKCDFVLPFRCLWIEVSNIKTSEYLGKINQKRNIIEQTGQQFQFFQHPKKLESFLKSMNFS